MTIKELFIGLFIALGIVDTLLILGCHELEKRKKGKK